MEIWQERKSELDDKLKIIENEIDSPKFQSRPLAEQHLMVNLSKAMRDESNCLDQLIKLAHR